MKCSSIIQDMTNWIIDHPDDDLPERIQSHLNQCQKCRDELESVKGWANLLRPNRIEWTPEENFYERLTEQALREKRRAALTDSTRRDFALDVTGWLSIFHQPSYRLLSSLAVLLLVFIPLGLWINTTVNTIGEFDYKSGRVMAHANGSLDASKGRTLKSNTTVQTTQGAESIVQLKSGAEVCVAPLSQVTFIGRKNVRIDRGKAFFNIPKQKSGFIVQLPSGMVRVLGTAFEISVVRGTSTVKVTRGVVEVLNGKATVNVTMGMKSMVQPLKNPTDPASVNLSNTVRWVNDIHQRRNQEELRIYYPSLAAPTPLSGVQP